MSRPRWEPGLDLGRQAGQVPIGQAARCVARKETGGSVEQSENAPPVGQTKVGIGLGIGKAAHVGAGPQGMPVAVAVVGIPTTLGTQRDAKPMVRAPLAAVPTAPAGLLPKERLPQGDFGKRRVSSDRQELKRRENPTTSNEHHHDDSASEPPL